MRLSIGYFLIIFSITVLLYLGLFYFGDLLSNKDGGVNHFFYPRKGGAILFEFFIFLLLLIGSIGLVVKNSLLSYILPIPVFFLLELSTIFIVFEGSYAYFSNVQTKFIGSFFLIFSAALLFFLWKYLHSNDGRILSKNKKVMVFGIKFLVSSALLVLWVLINKH